MKKINKITYTYNYLKHEEMPTIKLVGNWLKNIGFNVGEQYEVISCNNIIMLIKQTKNK